MLEGINENGLPVWFSLLREDVASLRTDMSGSTGS
jgi:hypothetical protein